MSGRVDLVLAELAERELDGLLVTNLVNVRWLTGFSGSSGAAYVGRDGTRLFLTDFRYLTQSAEQVGDGWRREIGSDLTELAAQHVPAGVVGIEAETMSVAEHDRLAGKVADGVEIRPTEGIVEKLRQVKDESELDRVRAAVKLADAALEQVLERGLAGRTERDVALELEMAMRRLGAEGVSFPPIVASGAHGALPHAVPRDVEIPEGTLVVIDWGAQLDGYASDCTRTYATGALDPSARAVYELVLEAQEAALAAVRSGPIGREVDAVARRIIEAGGHGDHFGHGLGHGVGLEIHEGPRLSVRGETKLSAGMVVTVEPGVYVPGEVGVRIEDLVVVRDDGPEVLSGLPKTLTTVPPASR